MKNYKNKVFEKIEEKRSRCKKRLNKNKKIKELGEVEDFEVEEVKK